MPTISKEKLDDVFVWLRQHDIQFNVGKIHRQFSDCVAIATLLKKLHPRLIDLHNYPPQNSIRLKLGNWETLNTKVLSKLGLQQTKISLENLAKGNGASIENLLLNIMMNERANKAKKENDLSNAKKMDFLVMKEEQIILIVVNKKIGDAIVQIPQQMVLYSLYEKTIKDVEEKTKILKNVENEVTNLEQEIQRQKNRIKDLSNQEKNLPDTGITLRSSDVIYLLEAINLKRLRNDFLQNISANRHDKGLASSLLLEDDLTPRPPSTAMASMCDVKTPTPMTNNKNSNILTRPKTLFKRKLKATKIPTRNGQILKTERERSILDENTGKQRPIRTFNETKEPKSIKSEIIKKPIINEGSHFQTSKKSQNITKKPIQSSSQSQTEVLQNVNKTIRSMISLGSHKTAGERTSLTLNTAEITTKRNLHDKCKISNMLLRPAISSLTATTTKSIISSTTMNMIKSVKLPQVVKSELISNNSVKCPIKKIASTKEIVKSSHQQPPLIESVANIPTKCNNNNNNNNNIDNGNNNSKTTVLTQQKESIMKKNLKDGTSKTTISPKKLIFSYSKKQ